MKLTVLVGNPGAKSRTLGLAEALADAIGPVVGETERTIIDLADVASSLFDWQSAQVSSLNAVVADSDFVIVATPTYKASYTGMLKAFLDRYDTNGLSRIVAIPVMTGGSPAHTLAPDFTLRPLLVELGASTPTRSLYFMTSQIAQQAEIVQAWLDANRAALVGVSRARSETA